LALPESISLPDEIVMRKIYLIRDQKVMLDRDLAELYNPMASIEEGVAMLSSVLNSSKAIAVN
jgi:hypothetical protein